VWGDLRIHSVVLGGGWPWVIWWYVRGSSVFGVRGLGVSVACCGHLW